MRAFWDFCFMKNKSEEIALEKLGKRIRELRKQKGYSNYEHFAYENGISRTQYGKYEKGENMKFLTFLKVLKGLDVTVEEFFKDIDIDLDKL